MAFIQIDPSQIKFDAPQMGQSATGFVPVDPSKIQFDIPQGNPGNVIGDIFNNRLGQMADKYVAYKNNDITGPELTGDVVGKTAGTANDLLGAGISAAVPDVIKQGFATGANTTANAINNTSIGQDAGDLLMAGKNKYNQLSAQYPRTFDQIENAGNILSLLGGKKAAEPIVREAKSAVSNAGQGLQGLSDMYSAKYPEMGTAPLDPINVKIANKITPDALETGAILHYNDAEKMGANLKPQGFANTVSTIKQGVGPQDSVDIAFAGKNPVTDTLSRLDDIVKSGQPVTLKNLDNMDTRLNSDISIAMRSGDTQTASDLLNIKSTLKNSSKTVKPEDLVNPQAFDSWRQGDTLWSAKSKMQQLQGIVDNAYNTENPDTAMRAGYRSLAKQLAKNPQGWTQDEISLIQQGAKRGLTAGALKIVGSRLMSGLIGAAAGSTGGPLGTVGGALAGEAIGWPMRAAANTLQEGRAMAPFTAVANRPQVLKAIPQSISEITKLPMAQQKEALDALLKAGKIKSKP